MKPLKSTTKKLITDYVNPQEPLNFGWPPACNAILYQPERPAAVKTRNIEETPSLKED